MVIACMMSALGVTAWSAASAGACLGFLVWNFHPAKVFMGDTGSLFLGGLVCAIAFAVDMPILLLPIAGNPQIRKSGNTLYSSIFSTIFFKASADSFSFNASSPSRLSGMSDSTPSEPTIAGILNETPSIP